MERHRRTALSILVALILTSGLVACSGFSMLGGVAGGVLTLVAVVIWFSAATTQTGCSVQSCLSLVPMDGGEEPEVGPCLSPPFDVGPCLGSLPPDAGPDAGEVGPCLSLDAGEVGPCLSPPLPDAGDEDAGDEDAGPIGPCLSLPPPDAEVDDDAGETDASPDVAEAPRPRGPQLARMEAIKRLSQRGVLPPDVAARLVDSGDEEV